MTSNKTVKSILESMLFTWGEPLNIKVAADVLNLPWQDVEEIIKELMDEYNNEDRGIIIRRVEKSYQFVTNPKHAEYIERLCRPIKKKKLSQSALETLAIVAYKQPVTRGEIESIRGIKCDTVLDGLEKKDLIEEVGRASSIGRPILYGTSEKFLKFFGFESIKELPEIKDIVEGSDDFEDIEDSDIEQIKIENLQDK